MDENRSPYSIKQAARNPGCARETSLHSLGNSCQDTRRGQGHQGTLLEASDVHQSQPETAQDTGAAVAIENPPAASGIGKSL